MLLDKDPKKAQVTRFFGFAFYKGPTENWTKFEFRLWDKSTLKLILIAIAEMIIGIVLCVVVINDGEAWILPVPVLIALRGLYGFERELSGRTYHKHQQDLEDLKRLFPLQ